ncbi:unnamed protein product [Boreogadus saida]
MVFTSFDAFILPLEKAVKWGREIAISVPSSKGGPPSVTESVDLYSSSLSPLLDRHAPVQPRTVPFPRSAPRYTSELRLLKRTGRVLERRLRTQDRLFTN